MITLKLHDGYIRASAEDINKAMAELLLLTKIDNDMDVLISAKQGGGKTRAAMILATGYLNGTSWNAIASQVLTIDDLKCEVGSAANLAKRIQEANVEVVIFDGAILDAHDMRVALEGVKLYRERCSNILAIYIEQHSDTPAIVLQFPD